MSPTPIPAAAVIMVNEIAYMTVRDWTDPNGEPVTPGGVDHLTNYFGDPANAVSFAGVIDGAKGITLNEVIGDITLLAYDGMPPSEEVEFHMAPHEPALCAFRLTEDGDHFVSRWFTPLGFAKGQGYSVFALPDDGDNLLNKFARALTSFRAGETENRIDYSDFVTADLTRVYSSVTVTRPTVYHYAGNADGGGDGFS